ncbi:carbohydrate porin [Sphingomonas glacialis]|nr:carbohydrate porin [Sphingomonas glacialis]
MAAILCAGPGPGLAQEVPANTVGTGCDEHSKSTRSPGAPFKIAVTYNSDVNAELTGGRRGVVYLQRLGFIGDADLARVIGWSGATAHVSVHSIVGTGLSDRHVRNLLTVSGIEAKPALRLFNLWIEQKVRGNLSIRAGQFTAAQEFAASTTANLLVNSTFGWPASFAVDLPNGGPAYPIAVPAVRLAALLDGGRTTIRAGVFAGDPRGRDLRGLAGWQFKSAPLMIAEFAQGAGGDDPAWSVVVGGWLSLDRFAASLPNSDRTVEGNYALYGIVDVRLWRRGGRTARGFARITYSPRDQNLVDRYADAGVALAGLFRRRPKDEIGLAIAAAHISPYRPGGVLTASRPAEIALELSYQMHLTPRLDVQPNAQLILNALDPDHARNATQGRRSAVIFGIRTSFRS